MKESQYANDTVLFFQHKYDFVIAINTIREYQLIAGLRPSLSKTKALYLDKK